MTVIKARVVDSTHLELTKPICNAVGREVYIAVSDDAESDTERKTWLGLSKHSLQYAYSDAEPDYPASLVKENNPEYCK